MEGPRCAGVAHPLLLLRGEDGRFATRPFHPSGEEERLPCHRYQGGLSSINNSKTNYICTILNLICTQNV